MRVLPYYIVHTFINAIKKLFRTWVAILIAIILGFSLIGGIVGAVVGTAVEDSVSQSETAEPEEHPMTAEDKAMMNDIIELIVGGISLMLILTGIYNGDKSGASIFTMPDVNFLFPSPMVPQSVLMFRTILQMGLALVSSLYLIFQIPNLVINAGLSITTALLLLIAWFFILFLTKLASVFTYTLVATFPRARKFVRPLVIAVLVLLTASLLITGYLTGKNLFEAAVLLFASPAGRYVPLFGWLRGLVMFAISGDFGLSLLCLVGLLALCVLIPYGIWHFKADFYEDALAKAAEMQITLENRKAGKAATRKKERSQKLARNGSLQGEGAQLFFTKTMYNHRRFSKFGFLTATCTTYLLFAFAICLFCSQVLQVREIAIIGSVALIAVFFRNMGNPAATETENNFLYLVPESPYKKVFYVLLGGIAESALDLLPAFVLSAIMLTANPLEVLPWYLLAVTLEAFCSSVGLFIEMILPTSIVPAIKAMLGIMLRMMAIIPGLIILVAGLTLSHLIIGVLVTSVVNLAVSALLFAITPGFLHLGK